MIIIIFAALLYYGSDTTKKWTVVAMVVFGLAVFYVNFINTEYGGGGAFLDALLPQPLCQEPQTIKQQVCNECGIGDMKTGVECDQRIERYKQLVSEYNSKNKIRGAFGFGPGHAIAQIRQEDREKSKK